MSLTQVRDNIQDVPQFSETVITGDQKQKVFRLDTFPVITEIEVIQLDDGTVLTSPTNYTISPDAGYITFVAAPNMGQEVSIKTEAAVLSDSAINSFLSQEDNDVNSASARALRAIAANQALVLKRIVLLNLETDGPSVSKALRELAKDYEARASVGARAFAEMVHDFNTEEERIAKEYKRQGF